MLGAVLQHRLFRWLGRASSPHGRKHGTSRVGYVLWQFPTFGASYIDREIRALRRNGTELEIFAWEPDANPLSADVSGQADAPKYYGSTPPRAGREFLRKRLLRAPWTVVRCWLMVVRGRRSTETNWSRDLLDLQRAAQLARALARRNITHVHSPWANQSALHAVIAARLLGITVSVEARASEIHRTWHRRKVEDLLRWVDLVITNSHYNARYLHDLAGETGPPIHVVYEGLEQEEVRAAAERERLPGPPRLVSVGRLVEPKGFEHLLCACYHLRERGVDFVCDIIGGAETFDTATAVRLRMLHTELKLEPHVRFRGPQPMSVVRQALREADVFVLPCVRARDGSHDITPNSLLEAMAQGLPVVSTTSGAITEIVDHGVDGLLVPPGDDSALVTALERLLSDTDLRTSLGRRAIAKIEARFAIDRNVEQTAGLFRSLAAK
jgi:glycosyltransferase involved in cell wall biosynthesis